MKTQEQLLAIIQSIWEFAPGLNKHTFNWGKIPATVTMLAATDSSALVSFGGVEWYINHVWKTNTITVERNK